jgi:hypothetical protein
VEISYCHVIWHFDWPTNRRVSTWRMCRPSLRDLTTAPYGRIEMDALNSIWKIERLIWEIPLKRSIRSKRSRFCRNVLKVGVPGSALLLVGNLWLRLAFFIEVIGVIVAIPYGRGAVMPWAIGLFGLTFYIFWILRLRCASKISKTLR